VSTRVIISPAGTAVRADADGLSVTTKLAYGVGALSDSLKTFCFTTFLLFYYTTVLGLPGSLLALAVAVGLVYDAAVDPLIGHLSDRATLRFGRRHVFMLAGALCAGLSLIAVFNPPAGLSTRALFAWLIASSFCLRSGNSMFMVPYSALGAEMAHDYSERTSVSAYRAAAVLVGTLLATGAAFHVFLPNESPAGPGSKFARESYESMSLAFGVAMIAAGLVATFGTLHQRDRLGSAAVAPDRGRALRPTMADALREPSFRALVLSSAVSFMATAINAALTMHFLTYHARVSGSQATTAYFTAFYAGAMTGVFAWVRVTRRIQKHHVYAGTMLVSAVLVSAGYWLIGEGRPLGTGNVAALAVLMGLVGLFGTAGAVVAPSMMADVTACDELRTGRRREGVFFGLYSLGQQLAGGLAILAAGVLVDRFARLVPGQATQSPATVERLAMLSALLPAALLVAAFLLARRYRLTREQVDALQREVGAARPQVVA
jgi:glycoside/pentoside/hexuronide:cation symporter, GPH family